MVLGYQFKSVLKRCNSTHINLLGKAYPTDEFTNISKPIIEKLSRNLHLTPNHPLHILKSKVEKHLLKNYSYKILDSLNPIVDTKSNFDDLLFSKDHPGRSRSDTYYLNKTTCLRTHTSAHQSEALKSKSSDGYLLSADVYRRDEIDQTHYPVFHQMEGIRLFSKSDLANLKLPEHDMEELKSNGSNPVQDVHDIHDCRLTSIHLRLELESLVREIFHKDLKIRWIEGYFPFTSPSWEMEVFYNGKWLEILGCGVIQQKILDNSGLHDKMGWAFGIGLERIAMVLFNIPDIRLFWSQDPRFIDQFQDGKITKFVSYSKYPTCYKDISFWCGPGFHENDFNEIAREVCGDLAEEVSLIDTFVNKKGRTSRCFRINYRSMDRYYSLKIRTFTNKEVDEIHNRLASTLQSRLDIELR